MTYDDDERPMVGASIYRPKSRKCCIVAVLGVSLALILVLAIAIPVGMNNAKRGDEDNSGVDPACDATSYPERCRQEMRAADGSFQGMSKMGLQSSDESLAGLQSTTSNPDCQEVIEQARESIREVFNETAYGTPATRLEACDDMKTKLSAAMEQVDTCQTILTELQAPEFHMYPIAAQNATQILSIVLALTNAFCKYGDNIREWKNTFNLPEDFNFNLNGDAPVPAPGGQRRLLSAEELEETSDGNFEETVFPSWMDSATSRHLLARPPAYNVIVAKDGSGKYKSVMDAINKAPKSGKKDAKRYIIYVKAGVYDEQIIVPKKLTNLMIYGDGIDRTVFTGRRSVALTRGMTTFASGTMIISGAYGFIGKFFTVRNTAGSLGHQAVACRVSADLAAFYRVKFDSFQDTLYAHSYRQFYRECIVQGTVDFIFGNGNAVLQNCHIIAKKSQLQGQQVTYTAQGRTDAHMNTGLSFQDCNFDAARDLKANVKQYPTFLGRPWKKYSTCVLLRPTLQAHIDPKGWMPWNTTSFGLYTSFFAEYKGKGPGSDRRYRVKWSHHITNPRTANRYQAASFISGKNWLPKLDMPYSLAAVEGDFLNLQEYE